MRILLYHLPSLKLISSAVAKRAFAQYTDEVYPKVKEIFVFDPTKERWDKFFFHSPNLLFSLEIQSIPKLVLVLSHGQASAKRGFNISQ